VTQEDLPRLPQLGAVLKESLRLYPPAWMLERQAQAADVVSGFDIPGGSTVVLSPYLTHRHPDFWANPEGFEPDRWLHGARRAAARTCPSVPGPASASAAPSPRSRPP
jgi:cytochrome P450